MGADDSDIELKKFRSDERRFVVDLAKWLIAGIAAVISFYVIDVGRLRLEEFRSHSENQRLLLQAYLSATESVQPDVWKCKLRVLETYSDDERIRKWATAERQYIENYSEQDALYRETLKVASHLVHRTETSHPERKAARLRFEELYWADLPYARESKKCQKRLNFRKALIEAEEKSNVPHRWSYLDVSLIQLSNVLREAQPKVVGEAPANSK